MAFFYGSVEAELERVQGANVWISIGLREGKNREVKNILGALGLTVGRLIRVSFGPFQLGDLEEGAVREIKGRTLRDQLGDKLIEESGADFDAPVLNEFSNAAVQGRTRREMEEGELPQEGERRRAPREREWISSTGERRRGREEKTEKVEPRRRGNANVWMAPGARPKGEKEAAKPARVEHQQPHRSAKFSGDLQMRPRRFSEEERGGEESGERRYKRPEGRFEREGGGRIIAKSTKSTRALARNAAPASVSAPNCAMRKARRLNAAKVVLRGASPESRVVRAAKAVLAVPTAIRALVRVVPAAWCG